MPADSPSYPWNERITPRRCYHDLLDLRRRGIPVQQEQIDGCAILAGIRVETSYQLASENNNKEAK